MGKKNK